MKGHGRIGIILLVCLLWGSTLAWAQEHVAIVTGNDLAIELQPAGRWQTSVVFRYAHTGNGAVLRYQLWDMQANELLEAEDIPAAAGLYALQPGGQPEPQPAGDGMTASGMVVAGPYGLPQTARIYKLGVLYAYPDASGALIRIEQACYFQWQAGTVVVLPEAAAPASLARASMCRLAEARVLTADRCGAAVQALPDTMQIWQSLRQIAQFEAGRMPEMKEAGFYEKTYFWCKNHVEAMYGPKSWPYRMCGMPKISAEEDRQLQARGIHLEKNRVIFRREAEGKKALAQYVAADLLQCTAGVRQYELQLANWPRGSVQQCFPAQIVQASCIF